MLSRPPFIQLIIVRILPESFIILSLLQPQFLVSLWCYLFPEPSFAVDIRSQQASSPRLDQLARIRSIILAVLLSSYSVVQSPILAPSISPPTPSWRSADQHASYYID